MKDEKVSVPYIVHESTMARLERTIKRLWILCIIIFAAFVFSNVAWIYYENQFEDTVVTQDVSTDTGNAVVTGIGDAIYGTSETDR